jgi:hypothetical protein
MILKESPPIRRQHFTHLGAFSRQKDIEFDRFSSTAPLSAGVHRIANLKKPPLLLNKESMLAPWRMKTLFRGIGEKYSRRFTRGFGWFSALEELGK